MVWLVWSLRCGAGAYNSGVGFWSLNSSHHWTSATLLKPRILPRLLHTSEPHTHLYIALSSNCISSHPLFSLTHTPYEQVLLIMPSISAKAKEQIQSALESATSGTGVPGLVFCAIDKKGNFLAENAVGMRGLDVDEPMTMDSTFYIASCTKMITGLAAMQLVEQGKIGLDSAEDLYKVAPEIKEKKVLVEGGKLVDRKGDITLRKLLTHTAGFGYSFFNEKLMKYNGAIGLDEFSGDKEDYLMQPLVNQPGSRWEYGVSYGESGSVFQSLIHSSRSTSTGQG